MARSVMEAQASHLNTDVSLDAVSTGCERK